MHKEDLYLLLLLSKILSKNSYLLIFSILLHFQFLFLVFLLHSLPTNWYQSLVVEEHRMVVELQTMVLQEMNHGRAELVFGNVVLC